jgi:hypothetical protein
MTVQFTGKINAKKLAATGITEDHLAGMANRLGGTTLAIVELHHENKTIDENGDTQVTLLINLCEPVPDHLDDTVRDLMRALYRTRPDVAGQAALTGTDDGPTPEDAGAAVGAQIERDDEGNPVGVWTGDDEHGKPIDHDGDHGPADA